MSVILGIVLLVLAFIFTVTEYGAALFGISVCLYLWLIGLVLPAKEWITNHVTLTVSLAVVYLFLGVLWSFFKWYRFVILGKAGNGFIGELKWWAEKENMNPLDFYLKLNISHPGYRPIMDMMPKMSSYFNELVNWVFLWPTSLVMWFVGDFVWNLFDYIAKAIYRMFGQIYDNITRYAVTRILGKNE